MVAGECKKHPGVQRVELTNGRGGRYYACPNCRAEKAGGGLPPSPPPKPSKKKAAKKAVKKAAKKAAAPPAPAGKGKSVLSRLFGGFGLGR
jgi:hypothetical protein